MLKDFCREYRWLFASTALVCVLFLAHFALYDLPLTSFLPSLWFVCLSLCFLSAYLFSRFKRKMLVLESQQLLEKQHLMSPSDQAWFERLRREEVDHQEVIADLDKTIQQTQAVIKLWSHQMKIPLSALSLMAQTNQFDQEDSLVQIQHLERYLSYLINYLKLSNKHTDYRFEELSVKDLMVELIKSYRIHFISRQISLDLSGDWQLKTDKKWLSFALEQVLSNALKYNKEGGQISIHLSDKGMTIRDTGIGILEEDIPRLGQEGFTGYNGHEDHKSTGLGLYMTKTILEQLELKLSITSQLDIGTSVSISRA